MDLNQYTNEEQEEILVSVEDELRETMYDGESWIADYRRLRVVAHKQSRM